jgi:general secretion pathway protein D
MYWERCKQFEQQKEACVVNRSARLELWRNAGAAFMVLAVIFCASFASAQDDGGADNPPNGEQMPPPGDPPAMEPPPQAEQQQPPQAEQQQPPPAAENNNAHGPSGAAEEPPPAAPAPNAPNAQNAPAPARPMPVRPRPARPSRFPERRGAAPSASQPQAAPVSEDLLPKTGGKPDEPVTFDFNDAPLDTVVKSIARMTGKNFDIDPAISSTRITVITHDKIPPEMAYQVLESLLNSRGFSLVESIPEHLIRIVQTGTDGQEKVPMVKGLEGVPKTYDELSTHIVTVKYADAAELTTILKQLGSKSCAVDAYARTNTLIITDTADGLRRIFSFLQEVDVAGFDTEMEIFTLEYSSAEVLAQQIQDVLMGGGSSGGSPQRGGESARRQVQPARPSARPTVPGQNQSMVVGSKEEVLRLVPDERLNSLIVVADAEMMERVRDLVAKLDSPTPYEANNMNIYKLLNANAEDVEKALNAILGTTPRQGGEKGGGGGGGGGAQSSEVQPFEKKVVVTRYERSNALPQRQVLVEAVIMDVSIQNNFELTVDSAAVTGKDGFAMGNTSNINDLYDVTTLATAISSTTGTTSSLLMANAAKGVMGLGDSGGFSGGLFDSMKVTVPYGNGTKTIKVPFVPFLVKALETLTDVDILSKPSLTTQDNEDADIVIGQELPVPTARSGYSTTSSSSTNTAYSGYYGLTSSGRGITREDVGVKMKVTPHINEGDYVAIEMEVEVSKPITSSIGIDVNDLGPTFSKSKVTNNVVVKDGSTGIIGGLMEETANHDKKQTPVLGDLPLVGWLFGTRNNSRTKHNVVVLVTPYIIKEGIDFDRLSKFKMDEFRNANVDVLFDKGFVKKVRKGAYMRNKYRPSIESTGGPVGTGEAPKSDDSSAKSDSAEKPDSGGSSASEGSGEKTEKFERGDVAR